MYISIIHDHARAYIRSRALRLLEHSVLSPSLHSLSLPQLLSWFLSQPSSLSGRGLELEEEGHDGRRCHREHVRGQGLPRQADPLRPADLHRRRHRRPHLRLRHRYLRRRDLHGPVPEEVLPGGVPEEAGGQDQPVLQVRQPAAADLHLLPLPRRPRRLLLRRHRHPRPRPQVVHARRRSHLPRRRRAQRRRPEHRHAHHRSHPPRRRRRIRQSVCAGVPVGDGAGASPWHAQHRVPADDHHRHPGGGAHQLRHQQDQGRVRVARQPGAGGGAGGHHHAGLPLPPRHPQLPPGARPPRGGPAHAPAHPRHGGHRRGVRRPGGGERGGPAGAAPVAEHRQAPVPGAAHHGRHDPLLPAAHGDQRHHVLRAGAVRDAGVQERRLPHVLRHHRARQRLRHRGVHRHRRPRRPPEAVPPGRRADDRVPARGGHAHRRQVRHQRHGRHRQGLRGGGGCVHLRLRRRVRLVVGAAGVAGAVGDLPAGDPAGGAEHQRLRQHVLHLLHRAGVPHHALPLQVRPLLLLRRVGRHHDHLHRALPAGDQERAHRGDGARLEVTLVLEKVRRRRGRARQERRRRQGGRRMIRIGLIHRLYMWNPSSPLEPFRLAFHPITHL